MTTPTCPHDYPWFRDGRCWPSHYDDNLGIYGPSVEPEVTTEVETPANENKETDHA